MTQSLLNDTAAGDPVRAVRALIAPPVLDSRPTRTLDEELGIIADCERFCDLATHFAIADPYDPAISRSFETGGALAGLAAFRRLKTVLALPLIEAFDLIAELSAAFDAGIGNRWRGLANRVAGTPWARQRVLSWLETGAHRDHFRQLKGSLLDADPHAIYPTSSFRSGTGHVVASESFDQVDAVMESRSFTTVKIVEDVLSLEQPLLRDFYRPLGRCVCLVDRNVETHYGEALAAYFSHHGITLDKLVYRAMEVDKGIRTVERMLGDFKRLGVSRNEPVLIVGGGVLADTGGLACALYHRNTPYVMLSTSIVAGIDAGPSPRTCCDGFGYKNLFGAYHAPVLSITDRSFFGSLTPGWLRHGVAEIIKMGAVKDAALFEDLETAGSDLIRTRFGTVNGCDAEFSDLSQRILGRAIQSYVESEYDNLYETHQARPHAYGHSWSPGFEIPAGLLHGHAVSIGMGFGAFLSTRAGWIDETTLGRVLALINSFDLSLWHDILLDEDLVWNAQCKMTEKRGGHLAAPVPQGRIGAVGYLEDLSKKHLAEALKDYRQLCRGYPRGGVGIEPLCTDVGLEDPSTVGDSSIA